MKNLRLVFLDCPIKNLENEEVMRIYSDVISRKQLNFMRTKERFVVGDKHDVLASHLCIYDVSHVYRPKLVLAIRNTYQHRAEEYGLKLPIEGWITSAGLPSLKEFERAQKIKGKLLDCNTWFVDPDYSFRKSGNALSEIGFFMACLQALRLGYDHLIGCTNEQYKASRWVSKIGPVKDVGVFDHPSLPGKHRMMFVESFYEEWLRSCAEKYGEYILNAQDICSEANSQKSLASILACYLEKPLAA